MVDQDVKADVGMCVIQADDGGQKKASAVAMCRLLEYEEAWHEHMRTAPCPGLARGGSSLVPTGLTKCLKTRLTQASV